MFVINAMLLPTRTRRRKNEIKTPKFSATKKLLEKPKFDLKKLG